MPELKSRDDFFRDPKVGLDKESQERNDENASAMLRCLEEIVEELRKMNVILEELSDEELDDEDF